MRRLLWTYGLGLLAASPWWLAVSGILADPAHPVVQPALVAGAVAALVGLAWLAGWLARRDPEAHDAAGLWAGGGVGGMAWLFGAVPVLSVWSQIPVLLPTTGMDAQSVLSTALSLAVVQAATWISLSALGMGVGGALIGWGAMRRGNFTLPVPGTSLAVMAVAEIVASLFTMLVVFVAMIALTESMRANVGEGMSAVPVPWTDQVVGFALAPSLVATAISMAIVVAWLRGRGLGAPRTLLVWTLGVTLVWASLVALALDDGAAWAVGVGSLGLWSGAALGAAVRLEVGTRTASLWTEVLERAPLALLGHGVHAVIFGVTLALGAVARISALTRFGTAAEPYPELVAELYSILAALVPAVLGGKAVELLSWGGGLWMLQRLVSRMAGPSATRGW